MKRNGFVFIESVIVLMVVALSLTMLISSYSLITRKTQEKEYYDRASDKYLLYSITNIGVNDECNYNLANSCGYEGINLQADEKNCNNTRVGKLLYNCSQTFKDMNIRHIYVVDDIKKELSQDNAVEKYDNGVIEYMKTLKKCNDADSNTCEEPISYMIGVFYRSGNYYYASLKIDAITEECEEGYYLSSITKKCEKIEYVIKFDKKEGSGGTSSIKVSTGNKPGNISVPSKENYTFLGYYTEENGEGDQYYDSDGKALIVFNQSQNITLYAHWTETRLAGLGTEENPYKIQFIEDLVDLSNNVNKEGNTYGGKYFILTKNLDFQSPSSYKNSERTDYGDINGINGNETLIKELTTGSGFEPIGVNSPYFRGIFDGKNFKISNLYINNTTKYNKQNIGLFGSAVSATIKNLIVNANIHTTNANNIGVIGYISTSTIDNVKNDASTIILSDVGENGVGGIIGAGNGNNIIKNTINYAQISNGVAIGGIIGGIDSGTTTIENCKNYGIITNETGRIVGGIVGNQSSSVTKTIINNCTNYGNIISTNSSNTVLSLGGIIGRSLKELEIANSSNEGNISDNNINNVNISVGGLVGNISNNDTTVNKIVNSYNIGKIEGGNRSGGLIGLVDNKSVVLVDKCYNSGTIKNTSGSQIAHPLSGGIIAYNIGTSDTVIINSYNKGAVNSNKWAYGIALNEVNSKLQIINSYNVGNINGINSFGISRRWSPDNSYQAMNNVYNYGTLNGTTKYEIISLGGQNQNLFINNAYYVEKGIKASDAEINATPLTENQLLNKDMYNSKLFVDILNENVKNIKLSDLNSSFGNLTLCNWKKSTVGYPELDCK